MIPAFPDFKPLSLHDRDMLEDRLLGSGPATSELSFTNLFIWRSHYDTQWSVYDDLLLFIGTRDGQPFGLPPIGPGSRKKAVRALLDLLGNTYDAVQPRIERAGSDLVQELKDESGLHVQPVREHFDYVYRSRDLIELKGNRYHSKRNHINAVARKLPYRYEVMSDQHVRACTELIEKWCGVKRCEADMNLLGEWDAIGELLAHFDQLSVTGGVILIDDRVSAFSFGGMLNPTTAVVHVEKADPDIGELYTVINQQFAEHAFADVPFVNREQDLGEPGLRKAKLSYHPDHLVEKYTVSVSNRSAGT